MGNVQAYANRNYFFTNRFRGASIDEVVNTANRIWSETMEILPSGSYIMHRNPFDPEERPMKDYDFLPEQMHLHLEGNRESFPMLLKHVTENGTIPWRDGTYWTHTVSGIIYAGIETLEINIQARNASGVFKPYNKLPNVTRAKGWIYYHRTFSPGYTAVFRPEEIIEQARSNPTRQKSLKDV